MNRYILLFVIQFLLFIVHCSAQNKSSNTFIFGGGGIYASFVGDTSKPTTNMLYANSSPYDFWSGSSCISDSATGKLKAVSNGFILFDSIGGIVENGDTLVPKKLYNYNYQYAKHTQESIILPKGSNGLYYIFNSTITDSTFDKYLGSSEKFPFDLLQYHILDANAKGGLGKVIQKNLPVITNIEINRIGMMACRHANGYDWWLLKQAGIDSTLIYKILVTADSVEIKDVQHFPNLAFGKWDLAGQSCFSSNGKKYAFSSGRTSQLFLADFDRCSGELRNAKVINIPIDSTTDPYEINLGRWDSLVHGVCFSPNDSFIYITRDYNIYQYELNNSDSATAWFRVKHGEDTILQNFEYYGQLQRGVDGRIYIGKGGNVSSSNSVIDKPNIKGVGCDFCRKCLRYNVPNTHTQSPANMPDFLLGADSSSCWPLVINEAVLKGDEIIVYPNPTSTILYVTSLRNTTQSHSNTNTHVLEMYNVVGELILKTDVVNKTQIDISSLPKGVYILRSEGVSKKVVVE